MNRSWFPPEGALMETPENKLLTSNIEHLEKARSEGRILEGRAILCDASHNLIVDLNGMTGIIPRSETAVGIDDGTTKEIAIISRVGKPVCFKVVSAAIRGGEPEIILSRKAAQEDALSYMMENLNPGDILGAVVTHLEPFGAFVDIGCGVVSLIGIENISISRISHPSDRFWVNQRIFCAVQTVLSDQRRISLSHKELLGAWTENAESFRPGETVRGIVRGIEPYGIFIELTPNLSGLAECRAGLKDGDHVSVYIKTIIPERMKIKLIVIDKLEKIDTVQLKYYITEGRLERWLYSPPSCARKTVETVFG